MKVFPLLICVALMAESAGAQYLREYVFAAPTPSNSTGVTGAPAGYGILPLPPAVTAPGSSVFWTAGGGVEQRFNRYFGVGGDLAGIISHSGNGFGNSVGTLSGNGYFHLPFSRVDLYATGGYTLLFADSAANGLNAGGGLVYWFQQNFGGLFEFRFVNVFGNDPPAAATHYYEVRLGVTFR